MTSRFLPFVSEDTPITTVYKKLLEGGKGVPNRTTLSLTASIYFLGIEKVREELNKLNEVSWVTKYFVFIEQNPKFEITREVFLYLHNLSQYVSETEMAILKEQKTSLAIAYIYSIFGDSKESPIDLGVFNNLRYLREMDTTIKDFHSLNLFKDDAAKLPVNSKEDLKAYIFYCMLIKKDFKHPVTLVYKGATND